MCSCHRSGLLFALLLTAVGTLLSGCSKSNAVNAFAERNAVETFKLENGMTIYLLESRAVPLVTLDMWVGTGAKDEPEEIAGVSHFLEHMMFKGTPRLGVGDYDRRIEELGGYLNAATSNDYTHYYMTIPSEHLDRALEDMSDVIRHSLIDPGEVERERTVILEEIRLKQDNPLGFLYDEITRRVFASGPYVNTVIGSIDTVSAMTRDQLFDHYARFYAPSNMAFVIVGDFDAPTMRGRLEELFAGFQRPERPWRESPPPTEFAKPEEMTWSRAWQQTYFFVTFPGPVPEGIGQLAAMDVTETILLGGRSSRLVNVLREKKQLVTSISGFFMTGRHQTFMGIYGTCSPENLEAAREALFAEIEGARDGGLSGAELRRAKRQIITDHLYTAETNTGKASLIGYSHALYENPSLLTEYPRAVEEVSEKDVLETMGLLARDRASFYVARPAEAEAVR